MPRQSPRQQWCARPPPRPPIVTIVCHSRWGGSAGAGCRFSCQRSLVHVAAGQGPARMGNNNSSRQRGGGSGTGGAGGTGGSDEEIKDRGGGGGGPGKHIACVSSAAFSASGEVRTRRGSRGEMNTILAVVQASGAGKTHATTYECGMTCALVCPIQVADRDHALPAFTYLLYQLRGI